eukprot:gene30794-38582_t
MAELKLSMEQLRFTVLEERVVVRGTHEVNLDWAARFGGATVPCDSGSGEEVASDSDGDSLPALAYLSDSDSDQEVASDSGGFVSNAVNIV